jgi:hypothetical protein
MTDLSFFTSYIRIALNKLFFSTHFRIYMHFENIINGDKALTDNINLFLNENWKEIFNELKPKIAESFGEVTTQLISSVLSKRPYKEFFNGN